MAAIAIACFSGTGALAQTSGQADEEASTGSGEGPVIIVTARSRAEDIQDVPLAITAFGEEDIERRGLQELDDVARFTPGFSFEDFSGGFAQPVIRGLATTRVTALESNVSTFFDGVYIPRSWAVDIGTASLQRVEIVKGPQSARYGRNAFAGAINYIPQKATLDDTFSGKLEGTIGSDERYDGGGYVNFGINDVAAIAGSYQYSSFDGSWDNAHPFANLDIPGPSTRGKVGGWENESYSISAIAEPTPGFTIEAGYYVFDVANEARASRFFADSAGGILDPSDITATDNGLRAITNCGARRFFSFSPLVCGDLPAPADSVVVDPRSFAVDAKTKILRAGAELQPTENLTISYLYANIDGDVNIGTSGEPNPITCGALVGPAAGFPALCNFQQTPVGGINYDSQELRVTFDNGTIRASVGGFLTDGTDQNRFTSINIAPITGPGNVPSLIGTPIPFFNPVTGPLNTVLTNELIETEVSSVFGELYWTSGDGRLTIGAEGRYSETEITATNLQNGLSLNDTFKEFTPRFTVDYELNPDVLLFATAGRGAKAGGFNAGARNADERVFDPEYNWTYEAGIKSALLNGDLIFNASVYYTDWSDIQINSADEDPANPTNPNVPSITLNLGNAKLYGVELTTRYQATDNLSIDATFSHTEGDYSEGTFDSRFSRGTPGLSAPCDNVVCPTDGDISGNKIERAAPTQASAGIQWDGQFGGSNSYYIRGDASWQSDFFADSANLSVIPERFLVNTSAGVQVDRFNVRVWARNLFDKKYVSNAFVVLLPFGNTYGEFFGERRTYGATVSVEF